MENERGVNGREGEGEQDSEGRGEGEREQDKAKGETEGVSLVIGRGQRGETGRESKWERGKSKRDRKRAGESVRE